MNYCNEYYLNLNSILNVMCLEGNKRKTEILFRNTNVCSISKKTVLLPLIKKNKK